MRVLSVVLMLTLPSLAAAAEAPSTVGTVISVDTGNIKRDEALNQQLHFCLFENGKHDLLYVGTKYGMWSDGWIELTIHGKRVFSGKVPRLLYGGTLLDLGDVIDKQPQDDLGFDDPEFMGRAKITGITGINGMFK